MNSLRTPRTPRRLATLLVSALAVAGAATTTANASPAPAPRDITIDQPFASDRVIVTYKAGTSAGTRAAVKASKRVSTMRKLSITGPVTELVQLSPGQTVTEAMAALKADPSVQFAEPDFLVAPIATSNDPYFTNGSLWGMSGDGSTPANANGSGAAEAWAAGYTGSANVVVGVIDEGIQYNHPDLAANIWVNPGETAGDNIDNDGNGYVDDVNGWDFYNNDATIFDGAADASIDAHGTHVSGTIGGVGNNGIGVAGVNWTTKIVSAKFLGPTGGSTSAALSALNYLVDLKVRYGVNIVAINNSWGGGGYLSAMETAINRAGDAGILFMAAAGNSGTNNDTSASYPSNYNCTNGGTRGWDCVVAVAAIDSSGNMASFSQYGATTVDIGAPGVGIWSTVPNNSYSSYSGTSMATPHVAGAAALCASMDPTLSAGSIRSAITRSAKATASLNGKTVTGGRLDVGAMTAYCVVSTQPVAGAPSSLASTSAGEDSVSLTWTDGATNESRYEVEKATTSGGNCGSYSVAGQASSDATSYTVTGLTGATQYCFRVRALNGYNGGSNSAYSNELLATTLSPPPPYVCSATTFSWINATTGGTSYVLGDDASQSLTLPFSFQHYGVNYSTAVVSSNGFLRLGTGASTAYANTPVPAAGDPNTYIAPWWDDLNPSAGGAVWVRTLGTSPNRQYVVSWNGIPHYTGGSTTTVSFQLVLNETTNVVTLQYLDATTGNSANDRGVSATVGFENALGTQGTQVSYQSGSITDGSARVCTSNPAGVPLSVGTATLPAATSNSAYSQTLAASGGTSPYTWTVASGSLPAGLSLTGSTGAIEGTPTTPGTYNFTVTATDSLSATASKALSITVVAPLAVTTSSLTGGATGTAYSRTLAATGGTTPYTWALASGTLPNGLTLNASTGTISGTPTAAGTFSFTVRATDAASRTATAPLSIVISAPPGAFSKSSPSNNSTGRSRTALVLTWAASTNAVSYEYCVDRVNNKICDTSWVSVGSARTATIGGLLSKTSYFWQVRAVNSANVRTEANNLAWWKFTTSV